MDNFVAHGQQLNPLTLTVCVCGGGGEISTNGLLRFTQKVFTRSLQETP